MGNNHVPDLSGKKFYRWTVLFRAPNNKDSDAMWVCSCECGSGQRTVAGCHLRSGASKSCGCYQRECAGKLNALPEGEGSLRQLFRTYKWQATNNKQVSFEISENEFRELTKGNCYYCGAAPAQILQRSFGTPYTYNGVDRLDSAKGYTKENCVSCCGTHNLMKLDMSIDEFLEACRAVVRHKGAS